MIKVGIIGATGYAGAELVRILAGHPKVELSVLTSRQYAGRKFSEIYPAMDTIIKHKLESYSPALINGRADVVFMGLPHKLPMAMVPELLDTGVKIIDLSADFRFQDVSLYEAHYQAHSAPELLAESVYGLPEIYFNRIKKARLVGNPGCYPTTVLLPLIPLLKKGFLDISTIIADAKSGVSGAGRSATLTTHFCEVSESFKPYKVAAHRHNPEMNEVLSTEAGKKITITFVPHLVPMSRGMQTTIYAGLCKSGITRADVASCLNQFYADSPFIRLIENRTPDTQNVRGTNFCDIGFQIDQTNNRLILMSAIDNLVKGAAGQAVQNMNIMCGFDQTTGLANVPYPI